MAKQRKGIHICGWCATNYHESCKAVIEFYDKKWYCYCEQCHPDMAKEKLEIEEEESDSDE